jgi:hypothetical protein
MIPLRPCRTFNTQGSNKAKNEFAIRINEDEAFMAVTKVGEFYPTSVDAFDNPLIIDIGNFVDWHKILKKWIARAKNESRFHDLDLKAWNEAGERKFT